MPRLPKARKTKQSRTVEPKPARLKAAAPKRELKSRPARTQPVARESFREEIHAAFLHPIPVFQPPVEIQTPPRRHELPDNYGDNQIYLMVRDPRWIYAYWEIQKDHEERTLARLGGNRNEVKSILRVYDTTEKKDLSDFFDLTLEGLVNNWYIEVQPNRSYLIEIGLLHSDGRFLALARSNEVTTPRAGMSEILDEEWMGIDFDKMYALSGGFQVGKSSMELSKLMEERLKSAVSSGSGGLSSPVKIQKRGFWFTLDCELIVYGATEPGAKVTVQGKEIKLRPDGTFSLRLALPDGTQMIDARAQSADQKEERTIIPTVERSTERPAPVLKSNGKG